MGICSDNHHGIVHDELDCPLCEALTALEEAHVDYTALSKERDALREHADDLEEAAEEASATREELHAVAVSGNPTHAAQALLARVQLRGEE